MESKIVFANYKVKESFLKLKNSKTEDQEIYKRLIKAFLKIEENAFCGIQISKKLIPKEYKFKNLWKYNLPQGQRLIYTVANDKVIIISIILKWMTHKEYEKKFKY